MNINDNDFLTKLQILQDILDKKENVLGFILNICENQQSLYSSEDSDELKLFLKEIAKEKQKLIDDILQYDIVFDNMFKNIKTNFEDNAKKYKKEISKMQSSIDQVMKLDIAIRAKEDILKGILNNRRNGTKKNIKITNKAHILNQYKENSKTRYKGDK